MAWLQSVESWFFKISKKFKEYKWRIGQDIIYSLINLEHWLDTNSFENFYTNSNNLQFYQTLQHNINIRSYNWNVKKTISTFW